MKSMQPHNLLGSSVAGRQVSSSKRSPRRSETSKAKKDLEIELLNNLKDQVSVLQREREELMTGKSVSMVPPAPPPPPSSGVPNLGVIPKPASRYDLPDFNTHVRSVQTADTIDKLERDLKSQTESRVRSDDERFKLQSRLEETQKSLISLQRDTSELAKQHSSMKNRHQSEILNLEKTNAANEAEITRLSQLLDKSQSNTATAEIDKLRSANRNYENEVRRLSSLLEERAPDQSLESEVKRQAIDMSKKDDEIRRLNNLLNNPAGDNTRAKDEISRLNHLLDEARSQNSQLLREKDAEIGRLRRQLHSPTSPTGNISSSEADRLYEQLRDKNAEIRRLAAQLEDSRVHSSDQTLLDQKNSEIRKLQQEIDDLRTTRFASRNFDLHDNPSPLPMQSPFVEQSEEFYKEENIRKDNIIINLRKQIEESNNENHRLREVSHQLQAHHHETLRRQHAVQKETERLVSSVSILNSSSADAEANHNYQVSKLLGDALVAATPISPRRALRMKSSKAARLPAGSPAIDSKASPSLPRPVIGGMIL